MSGESDDMSSCAFVTSASRRGHSSSGGVEGVLRGGHRSLQSLEVERDCSSAAGPLFSLDPVRSVEVAPTSLSQDLFFP